MRYLGQEPPRSWCWPSPGFSAAVVAVCASRAAEIVVWGSSSGFSVAVVAVRASRAAEIVGWGLSVVLVRGGDRGSPRSWVVPGALSFLGGCGAGFGPGPPRTCVLWVGGRFSAAVVAVRASRPPRSWGGACRWSWFGVVTGVHRDRGCFRAAGVLGGCGAGSRTGAAEMAGGGRRRGSRRRWLRQVRRTPPRSWVDSGRCRFSAVVVRDSGPGSPRTWTGVGALVFSAVVVRDLGREPPRTRASGGQVGARSRRSTRSARTRVITLAVLGSSVASMRGDNSSRSATICSRCCR
ncbi:hypothetical protein BDK89_0790 [Ilumatobacter fluminis]|uniref:Uncharacterized protein n=1 Tax=Ilumatobacter fluminis TaxID=467091 RepID=A0A4R7HWC4_9ACTN|nr:hypothetical protein BDK89_0790 [Ilumatobacter fluminis]